MSPIVTTAVLGILLAPAAEQPEPARVALDWHAPDRCPQREQLDARLHTLLPELGELGPEATPAQLQVRGQIEPTDGDRWEVRLVFESERGPDERRFSGPDCVALADAAALVIAVAVDPLAVVQTIALSEVEAQPSAEPEPPVEQLRARSEIICPVRCYPPNHIGRRIDNDARM